jgi:hypothetical protein
LEISLLNEEARIMVTPLTDNMDLTHRAWLEKKKIILARDIWFMCYAFESLVRWRVIFELLVFQLSFLSFSVNY